ncbi:unnamed protein product [Ixodes pacificus]
MGDAICAILFLYYGITIFISGQLVPAALAQYCQSFVLSLSLSHFDDTARTILTTTTVLISGHLVPVMPAHVAKALRHHRHCIDLAMLSNLACNCMFKYCIFWAIVRTWCVVNMTTSSYGTP